ncbi:hypothetical protein PFICI_03728 [Pestalotiopsis fici W106-1]|uniref:Azaphilone pigments biosynthesis cluster protein L N-terminal domain-containing protein n=1 Tax=Pestalotiopsis fici (strain W106-1 / CGMCC3.15140) TaxID=1229662 RepID=W3XI10_PESFW|nr:uncharacterized protein PFICI_03728 [Pestalotiopsis fici W106-1]ETS85703.1 hypothetical protein PFICI_03728 [Pestalotiopsis fici W106-1]
MADPLSMIASIAGVATFATATARGLITVMAEFRDAPEEISHIRRDVQGLAAVLQSIQSTCSRANLSLQDEALVQSLADYLDLCQTTMTAMEKMLKSFIDKRPKGRSISRLISWTSWTVRKGEIRGLRDRLQEVKASLNLTISALNGLIEGKGKEELRSDVGKLYNELLPELRNVETGKKIRRRVEDDIASSTAAGRRTSLSELTDNDLPMRRYLEQNLDTETWPAEGPGDNSWPVPNLSLIAAVRTQDKDLVMQLITQGASLGQRSEEGYTLLHFCSIYNDEQMAELLISHGADINTKDNRLRSPYQVAVESESMGVATLLVQNGCSIGSSIDDALELARRSDQIPGFPGMLKTLATRLNAQPQRIFPLQKAIANDEVTVLEQLCEAGFDTNLKDGYGLPPLFHALLQRRWSAVEILVRYNVDVTGPLPPDTNSRLDSTIKWQKELTTLLKTPLTVAAFAANNPTITRLLLRAGADPNILGPSALCAKEYLESAKALIEGGSDVNNKNRAGQSAIYWAAKCSNPALLRFMLEHGGDVDIQDNQQCTVLHVAAMENQRAIAEVAMEYGASTDIKNNVGDTALDIVRREGRTDITSVIENFVVQRGATLRGGELSTSKKEN